MARVWKTRGTRVLPCHGQGYYTEIRTLRPPSRALPTRLETMSRNPLDDAERDLFRTSVGPVRAVRNDRAAPARPRPAPVPRSRIADDRAVVAALLDGPEAGEIETGDELSYARPGVHRRVLRKLRGGHYRIDAELDLHGLTEKRARDEVVDFLAECARHGCRCARIIHGKGLGSGNRLPVLKAAVNRWLRRREDVLAFCSARPRDGGTGAVYVLLRRA